MKKLVAHPAAFAVLYVVFMIPTYILPYFGSNSFLVNTVATSGGMMNPAMVVHILCFAALLFIAWHRGVENGRRWLVVFPFIAMCFDFLPVISLIPLVPTVMHILGIIFGAMDSNQSSPTVNAA